MESEKTKLLDPPEVSSSLKRRDYHWIEITPEEFGEMLVKKLKKVGAKTFVLDVYCSNDSVYRNLAAKWMNFSRVKTIDIHFNREEGGIVNVRIEE